MSTSLEINSKSEIADVYNRVIKDVIKNMKDVFKEENISQFVLQDLETIWSTKFLKTRPFTLPLTMVPIKIMVPFKKSPSAENIEIREIEIMVPNNEAELLDFHKIFTQGILNAAIYLSDRTATNFLQQRINKFLINKKQVEDLLNEEPDEMEPMEDLSDDVVEADPIGNNQDESSMSEEYESVLSQVDGGNDSSSSDDDDTSNGSSQMSENDVNQSIYGSDGETLNSDDDVTDEDIETLFDSDNVILCQYLKVIRCKNKWRFYFKDGVMHLNDCDYAFHKIFGEATW